jgi:hypothetical protein
VIWASTVPTNLGITGLPLLVTSCSDGSSPPSGPSVEPSVRAATRALATTTSRFQIKEVAAEASFASFDPATCVETDVYVFGTPPTRKEVPVQAFTFVNVFQSDLCTNELLRGIFGGTVDASFQADAKLTGASLQATIGGTDFISEVEVQVEVDIAWTGTGELVSQTSRSRVKEPGFLVSQWFKGTSRYAAASGTVSVEGQNLTPNPADFGQIFRARFGELDIVRSR